MNIDQSRSDFEQWVMSNQMVGATLWDAWQGSRKQLVIELPQRCSYELQGMTDDANGDYLDYEETVAAIQLAGAKVK